MLLDFTVTEYLVIHYFKCTPMINYMLDTNIYDYILDNEIDFSIIKRKGNLFITNVQLSEIKNITNTERRNSLLNLIKRLNPSKLNLESGIWLDDLYWDDEQPWLDEVNENCNFLLGNSQKKKPWKDALIGEVSKNKDLILVTNDNNFKNRANLNGIKVNDIEEFLK